MKSWYINELNVKYSYFGDPCLNCGGPHLWKHSHTCGLCGGLDGHWSHHPNSYSPSPSPYYDHPIVFDAYRNNEEEEHDAQIRNMEKLILEYMDVMREQLMEQGGALKRMSEKLKEMMANTTTYNDFQVMVLANIEEEPPGEEKKLRQEISQFVSSIHDLQGLLRPNYQE
ncbi:hypothetical protein HAX54_045181 [Datura stramonium]|uniref:Uncharacterized protein n=1 Tax=Datura stramonium TaxID=4076 RepID=A0ABS8WJF9_DATST|nr:hypothetical protein [Datura stramonium]